MMNWYLSVVRDNYANFSGRARRSEYWYFVLANLLISLILFALIFALGIFGIILYSLYALAVFIPSLAVIVRRLHDVDKSGWFYFICLIPLIGPIWLLVLFATEGTPGSNQYGEDPKNQHPDISEIGTPDTI
jgi:uncharacterized membrane protein YhaH (DUF805 family)